MNRCTHLDEILHEHLPWQPLEPYWMSRSYSKSRSHGFFGVFSLLLVLLLSTDNKLIPPPFKSWVEVWAGKLVAQVLSRLELNWVTFWFHATVFAFSLLQPASCVDSAVERVMFIQSGFSHWWWGGWVVLLVGCYCWRVMLCVLQRTHPLQCRHCSRLSPLQDVHIRCC